MTPFHLYLYGPSRGPIETSFEQAETRLRKLPQLHFEPDGSFVWARDSGDQKIYGMVYDALGKIQYCDLQGSCSHSTWKELCQAITGGANDGLEVMLLPNRELQNLQNFEQRWGQNDPSGSSPQS